MGITICFINQKGGCGKSSSCFHLAGYYAQVGLHVLAVDADPQGSLSQGFLGSEFVERLAPHETLAQVFCNDSFFTAASLITQTQLENVDLIPANQCLSKHNCPSPELTGLQQFAVAAMLEQNGSYDITLIDCPPNLYACSWNALLAADYVVIPVPPEDFGTQGLRAVNQAIQLAGTLNTRLQSLGLLITRMDRRLLVHRAYEHKLRQLYAADVFRTIVPEAAAFKVALAGRQPVTQYNASSSASVAVAALAREIDERISAARLLQCVA